MTLGIDLAEAILGAARAKARELDRVVSLAIVDSGGYLVAFARMDGGRWVNVDIAIAKAVGAAAFQRDSSDLAGLLEHNPKFVSQMIAAHAGRLMIDIGSVVIRARTGELLGALAASGASGEEDEVIVRAALAAVADRL